MAKQLVADPFVLARTTIPSRLANKLLANFHHGRSWNNQHQKLKTRGFHSSRDCERKNLFEPSNGEPTKCIKSVQSIFLKGTNPQKMRRTPAHCDNLLAGQVNLESSYDCRKCFVKHCHTTTATEFPNDLLFPSLASGLAEPSTI